MPKYLTCCKVVLIFEPEHRGHHGEFLENLIFELRKGGDYLVYASPLLKTRLEFARERFSSCLNIRYLDEEWTADLLRIRRPLLRGYKETRLALSLARSLGASKLLFMQINMNQVFIGLYGSRLPCKVCGIVLNHYTPLRRASSLSSRIFAFLTGARKIIMYKWLLRAKKVHRLFVLNDSAVSTWLNRSLNTSAFSSLPDPLPVSIQNQDNLIKYTTTRRKTIALIGSLAPRKGCLEFIAALRAVPSEFRSRIRICIAGKFRTEAYDQRVRSEVKCLIRDCPELDVYEKYEFISSEELEGSLNECDCVVVPYLRVYGSSGMLGHACRYQKPLLACRDGLLGELVRENKLGLCVNPRNREEFAKAIIKIVNGDYEYDVSMAESYVAEASAQCFVEKLLK